MSNAIGGKVAGDPLKEVTPGFQLSIERLPFPALQLSHENLEWTAFQGVLLKMLFGNPNSSRITGSGVMVAPGVAFAARHVVEPELPRIFDPHNAYGFMCVALTPRGLDIWRVRQVFFIENNDVAILTLERASAFHQPPTVTQAILSTRVPPVGETVAICGFVAGSLDIPPAQGMTGRVHISLGTVSEQFLDGRDRCMLPGPCFSVAVGTPGGLSGGPVFDLAGRLVGVLSTSLGPKSDDVSFVSILHPALVLRFTPCWPSGLVGGSSSLSEYDTQLCEIERSEMLQANPAEGTYSFLPWS